VYQNLNGPQLAKAWQATTALRWKVGDTPVPVVGSGLPTRKGPLEASPSEAGSWNGLYLGLNAGYAWSADDATAFNYVGSGGGFVALSAAGALPTGFNLSSNGFMGGGQIGYNYQINDKLVAGVETDLEGVAFGVGTANWFAASPITYGVCAVSIRSGRCGAAQGSWSRRPCSSLGRVDSPMARPI
jgi:outer membrane immunogenic protein